MRVEPSTTGMSSPAAATRLPPHDAPTALVPPAESIWIACWSRP